MGALDDWWTLGEEAGCGAPFVKLPPHCPRRPYKREHTHDERDDGPAAQHDHGDANPVPAVSRHSCHQREPPPRNKCSRRPAGCAYRMTGHSRRLRVTFATAWQRREAPPEVGAGVGTCQQEQAADVNAQRAQHADHGHDECGAVAGWADEAEEEQQDQSEDDQDDDLHSPGTEDQALDLGSVQRTASCTEKILNPKP